MANFLFLGSHRLTFNVQPPKVDEVCLCPTVLPQARAEHHFMLPIQSWNQFRLHISKVRHYLRCIRVVVVNLLHCTDVFVSKCNLESIAIAQVSELHRVQGKKQLFQWIESMPLLPNNPHLPNNQSKNSCNRVKCGKEAKSKASTVCSKNMNVSKKVQTDGQAPF